jgi:hypothetical protein
MDGDFGKNHRTPSLRRKVIKNMLSFFDADKQAMDVEAFEAAVSIPRVCIQEVGDVFATKLVVAREEVDDLAFSEGEEIGLVLGDFAEVCPEAILEAEVESGLGDAAAYYPKVSFIIYTKGVET